MTNFYPSSCCAQDRLYKTTWASDGIQIGTGLALNGLAFYLLDRGNQDWTNEDFLELDYTTINGFDRSAVFNFSTSAAPVSDVLLSAAMISPFLLYLDKDIRKEGWSIPVMALEAYAYNVAITHLVKVVAPRFRPYAYNENLTFEQRSARTPKESFFSGHTSAASTVSFFVTSVVLDIHPDLKNKWLLWTVAAALPAYVGYLRYESGRHFPTDVIAGYALGAGIGYFIPKMHKRKDLNINVNPLGGISMSLTF